VAQEVSGGYRGSLTDPVPGQQGAPRDIDLVLITGAGASREFGSNRQKLPLMADWSNAIVQKLISAGPNYLEAIGLVNNMSGEAFESRLGDFLREVDAFSRIGTLLEPSAKFPGVPTNLMPQTIVEWHRQAGFHFDRITSLVHETLFDQFNLERIASTPAIQAYGELFSQLEVTPQTSIVYSTTNYDSLGEHALLGLGRKPDCGELLPIRGAPDPPLAVGNLLAGMPRFTPVLHLHGKVGWYFRKDDQQVHATGTSRHDPNFGVPIVMLPDPAKAYDGDVISAIWSDFVGALVRTKRVLVLGHSLADNVLLKALRDYVTPPARLAVTVFGQTIDDSSPVADRVRKHLPGAAVIPTMFGIDPKVGSVELSEWLKFSKT
jgi:hypothetical protein